MARIYHNAGSAGREYSKLGVYKYDGYPPGKYLDFQIKGSSSVLNRAQLQDLVAQIQKYLGSFVEPPPPPPMIEGEL